MSCVLAQSPLPQELTLDEYIALIKRGELKTIVESFQSWIQAVGDNEILSTPELKEAARLELQQEFRTLIKTVRNELKDEDWEYLAYHVDPSYFVDYARALAKLDIHDCDLEKFKAKKLILSNLIYTRTVAWQAIASTKPDPGDSKTSHESNILSESKQDRESRLKMALHLALEANDMQLIIRLTTELLDNSQTISEVHSRTHGFANDPQSYILYLARRFFDNTKQDVLKQDSSNSNQSLAEKTEEFEKENFKLLATQFSMGKEILELSTGLGITRPEQDEQTRKGYYIVNDAGNGPNKELYRRIILALLHQNAVEKLKKLITQDETQFFAVQEVGTEKRLQKAPTYASEFTLRSASELGLLDVIQHLLDSKVDVNAADGDSNTPLHLAAAFSQPKTVQFLLDHKANPNLKNTSQYTSFEVAIFHGNLENVQYLFRRDPNLLKKDQEYFSKIFSHCPQVHLSIASRSGNVALMEFIHKESPEQADFYDVRQTYSKKKYIMKPFDWSIHSGNIAAMDFFVQRKLINPKAFNMVFNMALLNAAEGGNVDAIEYLYQLQNPGESPLSSPSFWQQTIVNSNAEIPIFSQLFSFGRTLAVEHGLQRYPELWQEKHNTGYSSIMSAAFSGYLSMVKFLLRKKTDFWTLKTSNGFNIFMATIRGARYTLNTDLLEYLLSLNANFLEESDNYGDTPLHWAAYDNALAPCLWLIQKGARVDLLNRQGMNAHAVVKDVHSEDLVQKNNGLAVLQLFEAIPKIFEYVIAGKASALIELLRAYPVANLRNKDGQSLLHLAFLHDQPEIAEILFNLGANVACLDLEKLTPYLLAIRDNHFKTLIRFFELRALTIAASLQTSAEQKAKELAALKDEFNDLQKAAIQFGFMQSYETVQLVFDDDFWNRNISAIANLDAENVDPYIYKSQNGVLSSLIYCGQVICHENGRDKNRCTFEYVNPDRHETSGHGNTSPSSSGKVPTLGRKPKAVLSLEEDEGDAEAEAHADDDCNDCDGNDKSETEGYDNGDVKKRLEVAAGSFETGNAKTRTSDSNKTKTSNSGKITPSETETARFVRLKFALKYALAANAFVDVVKICCEILDKKGRLKVNKKAQADLYWQRDLVVDLVKCCYQQMQAQQAKISDKDVFESADNAAPPLIFSTFMVTSRPQLEADLKEQEEFLKISTDRIKMLETAKQDLEKRMEEGRAKIYGSRGSRDEYKR